MKQPLHIRVFELKRDRYQLPTSFTTLEEYVIEEIENGYIITGMHNFGIEKLQVISYYAPGRAKKFIETGSMVSNLADAPAEEV